MQQVGVRLVGEPISRGLHRIPGVEIAIHQRMVRIAGVAWNGLGGTGFGR